MRVTSAMIVNNFMRNLSKNQQKVDKLLTQMANNSKYAHISDDPVSVIYGRSARYKLHLLEHYTSNLDYGNTWLIKAEDGLTEIKNAVDDAYVECIDSTTDAKTDEDRQATAQLIGQLRDHVLDALNTALGDKFAFGAYNTTGQTGGTSVIPPFTLGDAEHMTFDGLDLAMALPEDRANFMKELLMSTTSLSSGFSINDEWRLAYDGVDLTTAGTAELDDLLASIDPLGDAYTYNLIEGLKTDPDRKTTLMGEFDLSSAPAFSVDSDLHLSFTSASGSVTDLADASENDWKRLMTNLDAAEFAADCAAWTSAFGGVGQFSTVDAKHLKFNGIDLVTTPPDDVKKLMEDTLSFEMGPGINMDVTLNGVAVAIFDNDGNNIYNLLDNFYNVISREGSVAEDIEPFIKPLQDAQAHILQLTATVGGRMNRIEMLTARYDDDYLNYTQMKSDAEDADEAELIMRYEMAMAVYEASLKTGANIMQMSLLDFLS